MEWSTKPQRNDQPFGSWADDLAAAFVRLEPRRIADQHFEGTITRVDAAPIRVSLVTATRHTVLRLASHIASSTDDLCFINLQLEGLGRTTQRGHEQISAPGDLTLADTTEPFEIANCRNFKLFCFAVPRQLLPKRLLDRPRLNLSATEPGRALSRTLSGYAELCLSESRIPRLSALVGTHMIDLISQAPEILADTSAERVHVPVLLSMMLDYIDRHSDDSGLGAATLAAKFRCSEPMCTGCLQARAARSANTSTRNGSWLARARCSIRAARTRPLPKSPLPPASATSRTSIACSSVAMDWLRVSFAARP